MPTNYDDAYQQLKDARDYLDTLLEKQTKEERYAHLRIAFYHLYQATNIATMCYEVSNYNSVTVQGESYIRTREEVGEFLDVSRHCHMLLEIDSDDKLLAACHQWLHRSKAFVDELKNKEACETNIQYARIPEPQDYSIISKTGKSWNYSAHIR